jgi:hypothetical protein
MLPDEVAISDEWLLMMLPDGDLYGRPFPLLAGGWVFDNRLFPFSDRVAFFTGAFFAGGILSYT